MASESTSASQPGDRDSSRGSPSKIVRIGKYDVFRLVAKGGMGTVYKARDTQLNRDVALKVLPRELAQKPLMLERFKREARSAAKLRHDNVVTVLEAGEYRGTFYLAMEFVEGVDLYDYVQKHGPLAPEEARLIMLQGADALRHAHAMGIVHRDIKPSNFLLSWVDGSPHVKLLDFGLARDCDDDQWRVTRAGTTVGTVDYMSPEQARDSGAADVRSDLYSLGATWYYLLTGQPLFSGGGIGERLLRLMQEDAPDVRLLNPRVEESTWEVLAHLLAKNPDDRFQTPDELMVALHLLNDPNGTHLTRPSIPNAARRSSSEFVVSSEDESRSRRLWYVLSGIASLLLLGGLVIVTYRPGQPPTVEDLKLPFSKSTASEGNGFAGSIEKFGMPGAILRTLPGIVSSEEANSFRKQIEQPWKEQRPLDDKALIVRVGRAIAPSPASFRSLHEACKVGLVDQPLVVELHDNGPLFESSLPVLTGRNLTIRAGPGYRPLVVWDLSQGKSTAEKSPTDARNLWSIRQGKLSLEGLEFVARLPDNVADKLNWFDVEEADLSLRDCIVSVAGRAEQGMAVAHLRGTKTCRCRIARCLFRGVAITALSLDAPSITYLDQCLVVGKEKPLLSLGEHASGVEVNVVCSTLVSESNLLARSSSRSTSPIKTTLQALDSLFGGAAPLQQSIQPNEMRWKIVNCLFAGWERLDPNALGIREECVIPNRWPGAEKTYELSARSPSAYHPSPQMRFASSVNRSQALGCNLATLPRSRDNWEAIALEPKLSAPLLLTENPPPEIPRTLGDRFAGGEFDVHACNLGEELAKIKRFAPRIVLRLKGSGEAITSPIHLKGVNVVIHFDRPADPDDAPLVLKLDRTFQAVPLLDLENGDLDVIGGTFRLQERSTDKASHLIRVRGGSLRLFRTRLEGPTHVFPQGYQAALAVAGSGDAAVERGNALAINECVILSGKSAIVLDGFGCRVSIRQSLVVAGTDGLCFFPGVNCRDRLGMGAALYNVTFACQRAVVHLGDVANLDVVSEPIVIQSRDCAYLNPFPDRSNRAGMIVWEGKALPRGLLTWQGQGEGFDRRLHFLARCLTEPMDDKQESQSRWRQIWGWNGTKELRELAPLTVFDSRRWALERLALRTWKAPGANLAKLGISTR